MKQIDYFNNKMSDDLSVTSTDDENHYELSDTSDLPTSLIITNIDSHVFTDCDLKNQFEEMFKKFEENVTFQYFKSFRRVRVNYETAMSAANARIQCHQIKVGEEIINCYFAGPTLSSNKNENADNFHLLPPVPDKQFLISPPASPPVGWEPVDEAQPVINPELLSALANLTPGEAHELHPQTESQPAIVVHVCEDETEDWKPRVKIQQTARPGVNKSLSESSDDSICATPP